MLKTNVGFCIDESGSVRGILKPLVESYNKNVGSIRESVIAEGQEATMTALAFGDHVLKHRVLYIGQQVQTVEPLKVTDLHPTGMTPLFDSLYRVIKKLEELDDGKPDTTFVVSVITDGQENSSRDPGISAALALMEKKIAMDRWTFTFLVPKGYGDLFCRKHHIPPGNVQEWDEKTEVGTQEAFTITSSAFSGYFASKSIGVKSTKTFYSDIAGLTVRKARKDLSEITKQVSFISTNTECQIRTCVIEAGLTWIKGAAFYHLIKPEKRVHDYKLIALRVKTSGKVYCGKEARVMLGIDVPHMVRLVPGDHNKFDVFIQSTSFNRKIPAGTEVMYWPKVGTQKK